MGKKGLNILGMELKTLPLSGRVGQTTRLFCGREIDEAWPAYYLRNDEKYN